MKYTTLMFLVIHLSIRSSITPTSVPPYIRHLYINHPQPVIRASIIYTSIVHPYIRHPFIQVIIRPFSRLLSLSLLFKDVRLTWRIDTERSLTRNQLFSADWAKMMRIWVRWAGSLSETNDGSDSEELHSWICDSMSFAEFPSCSALINLLTLRTLISSAPHEWTIGRLTTLMRLLLLLLATDPNPRPPMPGLLCSSLSTTSGSCNATHFYSARAALKMFVCVD